MKSQLPNAAEILNDTVRKIEEARLAGYAAIVAESQAKARSLLVRAEKALKKAQAAVTEQSEALAKFAEEGDTDHLSIFGVDAE